jgi:S1-C subfamily serine protease
MEALLSLSNELAGAVERIAPSIVAVHARRRLPSTGIHWRPGIVVTAEHTVRAEDGLTVETPDGRSHPATLVGRDPGTDLAVLKITTDLDGPPAPRGDDGALRVGHMVLALGYGPRASWGVISALGPRWRTWRGGEIDRLVRLDLVLYPGFSGGPLVDAAGHVVGVNTSALARDSRLAVPVTTVGRVVDELLRQGHVSRGYLGIGMQPVRLPDGLRAALGLPGDGGLIVVTVEPDGPAARAGLLLGDVLVALDGVPTADLDDVQGRLGGDRIGTTVTALVVRAGARAEVRVTVGERPRRGAR